MVESGEEMVGYLFGVRPALMGPAGRWHLSARGNVRSSDLKRKRMHASEGMHRVKREVKRTVVKICYDSYAERQGTTAGWPMEEDHTPTLNSAAHDEHGSEGRIPSRLRHTPVPSSSRSHCIISGIWFQLTLQMQDVSRTCLRTRGAADLHVV